MSQDRRTIFLGCMLLPEDLPTSLGHPLPRNGSTDQVQQSDSPLP